ncbi:MAG TPA: TRAP transporter substrate-binding protein DctP [Burkholderiaceae bacterium]|jgi:TRAP-type C4-dicarboxylate transport system substrate-binding protein|nr:TRAP transporter substrate-binding protein DctP [Burkholderiaceae bacterium]
MKRTLGLLGTLSVIAMSAPAIAQTKLTYGSYLPSTHVNNVVGIEPFSKRIEKDTGGKVKIEMLSGGAVAKATASIDSVRDGVVNASMVVDSYVQKQVPAAFTATDLGVIGRNSIALSGATNEYNMVACAECVAEQKKLGIISMAFYSTAPYTMMCKPDLRSMADIKGKKIRSASSFSIMFKEFGMVPVNITSEETYEAMQRGQVDCSIGAAGWLKSYSLWDVAKNVLDTSIGAYTGGLLWAMSAESWGKLKPDEKAAFKKNLPLLAADVTFGYIAETDEVRKLAADKGVKFNKPDKSFTDAYEAYGVKEIARAKDASTKRGLPDGPKLIDLYLALVKKWEKLDAEEIKGDKQKFIAALQREVYSKVKW